MTPDGPPNRPESWQADEQLVVDQLLTSPPRAGNGLRRRVAHVVRLETHRRIQRRWAVLLGVAGVALLGLAIAAGLTAPG